MSNDLSGRVVEQTYERLGRVDALVNNAGLMLLDALCQPERVAINEVLVLPAGQAR